MKVISSSDIKKNICMLEAIAAAQDAYRRLAEGSVVMPMVLLIGA